MTSTAATSSTSAPAKERLPFVVPLLAVGTFLMCTSAYIVAGLLQQISTGLDVNVAQVGLLITAFAIGMVVGAPVMAVATLRLPRRSTLVIALVVFALGHVIAALSASFAIVLVARVLTAVATGAFWSVASVVATTAAGPTRSSRALGVMMSGVGLATVAGVPLGPLAGQLIGWRGAFWGLAVLAAVAAVIIHRFAPADEDRAPQSAVAELQALAHGKTWLLVAATVLITGAYMGAFSYLTPLATERTGLPERSVPIVLVCFGIGAVIGTNLAGRFADRRPLTTLVSAAVGVAAVLGLLFGLSVFVVPTIVLVILLGIVGMAVPPVATGLAVRFAPSAPTLAAALSVAAFNGGTAIASWLESEALDGPLGVTAPEVIGLVMVVLGLIPLGVLALRRATAAHTSHA
ncbi:MFS transporter [Frondihabitans sucicola]|uniref:MFS transporter n=1 Tax=Frondihabitans sucicola TaxID=1268041 RepID=A0ABM8GTD4_9MICO|nr:MFS transporter [Frondihabitans sucicola]BDZ51726.1 MFS transporter [Frondihabitans sucicola]